jgi:hypothetical protein
MGMLSRLLSRAEPVRVRKIRAGRAVFESEEIQRIDIELILDNDIKIRLEMHPQLAHKLISQLTAAYIAINPPIRNYGGGVPFDGQG